MIFSGFLDLTLSDYKGHAASIVYTQGCNFNCPYCHNKSLIPLIKEAKGFSITEVKTMIKNNPFIDGLVITGGEPTVHKNLVDFIKEIADKNIKIKLDTNGSNPKMLKHLLDNSLIDYVAMDIKAPFNKYKSATGGFKDIKKIKDSIELIKSSQTAGEFRTTSYSWLHTKNDLKKIAAIANHKEATESLYLKKLYLQPGTDINGTIDKQWLQTLKDISSKLNTQNFHTIVR
ncbi:MAG: anaerobic ribonucleoside-triphosphate reductase activating protein [Deltaproteobacteria bacterium]|nr:anaerobic ribonucleoside-triphosphate reductase activating protein [Deltaproteobacteria bacterium]